MPVVSITNSQNISIPLTQAYNDTGWIVTGPVATHGSCNPGYIINSGLTLISGQSYQVKYSVSNYSTGYVQAFLGTAGGAQNTANGSFVDNITGNGSQLSFYSNGDLSVSLVSVSIPNVSSNFATLSFNENTNRWMTFYSFDPDFMVDYNQNIFSFKLGSMYQHDSTAVPFNNFYGNQFSSQVQPAVTGEDAGDYAKLWFNFRIDSDGAWYAPQITTPPSDSYPIGQYTDIVPGDLVLKEGMYWADIRRDRLDPNFASQIIARFNGRPMRGTVLQVLLQSDAIKISRINSLTTAYTFSERKI